MRPAFILSIVLMFTFQSTLSQVIEEPETNKSQQELYDFYTLKKNNNETAAWVLLGGGAALFTVGVVLTNSATKSDNNLSEAIGASVGGSIMMISGGGLAIASVPFFIFSSINKNKANLALKGGSISFDNISIPKTNYLVLSLNISLDN